MLNNRLLNRLSTMIDNAIEGKPIENNFDESKVSQLETKLSNYLQSVDLSKKQLVEEKVRVDELISDISHQTKNSIANIMLYSELLVDCDDIETKNKYAQMIVTQSTNLNFLVNSLVKTAMIENGIINVNPCLQPISILLNSIRDIYPSIEIEYKDSIVNYDLKWTTEAIINIIDNALKYGSTVVKINVTYYELFFKIDIIDNGMGIGECEIPKIFKRFYRSERVAQIDGFGIGLYLTRKIIIKQSGYIRVKSTIDKGSVFSVYLPIV